MSPLTASLPYSEVTRRADEVGKLGDALLSLAMTIGKDDFELMIRDLRKVAWRFSKESANETPTLTDIPVVARVE